MFRRWFGFWLAKVALAVLMPLMLLVLAEGFLRLRNYGINPIWTVSEAHDGEKVWRDQPDIGRLWFIPGQARSPVPFRVADTTNTLRVVVLGESAAMGDPVPAFGLARQLEVMLAEVYPDEDVEVINAAMTAIDSSVIVTIARDIARLKPDAVVVYMGNNEVVGPFGPSPDHHFMPSLDVRYARAVLWLRSLRIGQFLRNEWYATSEVSAPSWRGLGQFSDRAVNHDSPVLNSIHRRYAENLTAMVSAIRRGGSEPLFATMASRPFWAPFGPLSFDGAEAARMFHQQSLDLLASGDRDAAVKAWKQSRDLDPLRFRVDSEMNRLVRDLANQHVPVVDVESELHAMPVDPSTLFWDHVHLTPSGNYEVARMFVTSLRDPLAARGFLAKGSVPPVEGVLSQLVYTVWDDLNVTSIMHQRLLREPFAMMSDHLVVASHITARFRTLRNTVDINKVTAVREQLQAAVSKDPTDDAHAARLARIYEEFELWPEALGVAGSLVQQWPHVRSYHHLYGRHLVRSGRVEEGLRHLEQGEIPGTSRPRQLGRIEAAAILADLGRVAEALAMLDRVISENPTYAKAWYNRGVIRSRLGQLDLATRDFQQALAVEPDMAEAYNNLGVIALKLNRRDDAERHFRQAVELFPLHAGALRNLALVLEMKADPAAAGEVLSRLVICDPDWNPSSLAQNKQGRKTR
jgi:tetratricopeptide (TPR) repeat protein